MNDNYSRNILKSDFTKYASSINIKGTERDYSVTFSMICKPDIQTITFDDLMKLLKYLFYLRIGGIWQQ